MVIDQTPSFEEIEDSADGTDVSDERFTDIGEGDFSGGIVSEVLNDGIPVVLVNPRGLRRRFEELREKTHLAFVNRIP